MFAPFFEHRCVPTLALAFAAATVGCSHGSSNATATNVATAAPVYPGAQVDSADMSSGLGPDAPSGKAFETSDSFDTVYNWYKKNLPTASETRHMTSPWNAAVFVFGTGSNRLGVTVEAAPICCKTLIVIGHMKA